MAALLPPHLYTLSKTTIPDHQYSSPVPIVSSITRNSIQKTIDPISSVEYTPGVFDHVFLNLFRNKMVQEVGWDSEKPGYDGLIDVANRLMVARSNSETKDAAVRILRSLFPPLLLELYKILIAPIAQGKLAAVMVVNNVDLPDGSSLPSGVFVERCKYLEESKCVGICVNTCKLPTQEFFMDHMGVPLLMEPNFNDYSCQFKFGVSPPEEDSSVKEPCLEICPNATRRRTSVLGTLKLSAQRHKSSVFVTDNFVVHIRIQGCHVNSTLCACLSLCADP